MIPYYFADGHVHYARYGLLYLRIMEALPVNVLEHFTISKPLSWGMAMAKVASLV